MSLKYCIPPPISEQLAQRIPKNSLLIEVIFQKKEEFGFAKIFFSVAISPLNLTVGSPGPKKIFFFRKIAPISKLFLGILCASCSEMGGGIQYLRDTIPHLVHVL